MKKFLAVFLSAILTLSCIGTVVFADTGLENAITTVKSRIDIPAECNDFSSDVRFENGQTIYELYWNSKGDTDYVSGKSISVSITDSGEIMHYYESSDREYDYSVRLSKFTDQELLEIADSFIKRVNPSLVDQLPDDKRRVSNNFGGYGSANVEMKRCINGVPFCNDQVYINIDTQTGKVLYMSAYLTKADAPSIENVMGSDAANRIFKERGKMKLCYTSVDENKTALVYVPERTDVLIDATTGDEVTYKKAEKYFANELTAADEAMGKSIMPIPAPLTPEEQANVDEVEGLVDKDTLTAYASSLTELGLDKASLVSVSYEKSGNEYLANLNYYFSGEKKERTYAYLTLNAKTCEIISYYGYRAHQNDKKAKVSREEAEKTASAFAEKYISEFKKTTLDTDDNEYYGEYNISFVRQENNTPFYENFISISVDGESGYITSVNKSWGDDYVFESPEGIISADAALDAYIENAPATLLYEDMNSMLYDGTAPDVKAVYVQRGDGVYMIDARTAKPLNFDGGISEGRKVMPNDIEGHYGEDAIVALTEAGILNFKEGENAFRPDDVITQEELLNFVVAITNFGVVPLERENILESAVVQRLINKDEWKPEEPQTRKDGAKYIIRGVGYENIAVLSDIFNCGFADSENIPNEYKGYIALAKGFNIVKGDEMGRFNPDDYLSRADAAIMIYNYVSR